jgi:hypothetical protein
MKNRLNRERWRHDVEARQRSVVFPDTVQNEVRFWRNLGKQGWTTTSKIGLVVLGIFVFGALTTILLAVLSQGPTAAWVLVLAMLLVWGPIFGLIAWATRRTWRRIDDRRAKTHKL